MFEILKLIVTAILVVAGWFVIHFLSSRRDRINKRKELSLERVISGYKVLLTEISGQPATPESARLLSHIIADLQLFGNEEQVKAAKDLAKKLVSEHEVSLDPTINMLRDSIRKELGLSAIEGNVQSFVVNIKKPHS